ncbi:MAG: peptidase S1, partial [Candidatus Nephthysia bennettiae]
MSAPGFGEVAERLRRSTVQVIHPGRGGGSGVIWTAEGVIVTNSHVARDRQAQIELWDGRRFDAEVTARDLRRDVAVLRIRATGLPESVAGDSSLLRAGELVVAVGNPLGFIGALTTGVVHGLGPLRGLGKQNWVQAAIRLAPGNSGGPLADARGRVVGINTMVVSGGLGLAVPSNVVADFLRRGGSAPSLGVVVRPVAIGNGGSVGLLV